MTPMERMAVVPPPGLTAEQVPALTQRFNDEQLRVLAEFPPQVGGLFPNCGIFSVPFPTPQGLSAIIAMHTFVPKGVDRFEFFNWYLAEKTATQEMRESMRRASTLAFGISGFVESDDADTWPQMTQAARGAMGRRQKIRYQARTGEDSKPADWPGPGRVYAGFTKDDAQWNWWTRYFEVMTERER